MSTLKFRRKTGNDTPGTLVHGQLGFTQNRLYFGNQAGTAIRLATFDETGGGALNDLSDVTITGPSSGHMLVHNGSVFANTATLPAHNHGFLSNTGAWTGSPSTIATSDYLVIADNSESNKLVFSTTQFHMTHNDQFLRRDGTWQAAGGGGSMAYAVGAPGAVIRPANGVFISNVTGNTLTTLAFIAGRMDISPFMTAYDFSTRDFAISVSTAASASTARIVIYASDADGRPTTLLMVSDVIDCSTVGTKQIRMTYMSIVKHTLYWIGVWTSSTQTLRCAQTYNAHPIAWTVAATPVGQNILRRAVTYHATNSPGNWTYVNTQHTSANAVLVLIGIG